MVIGAGALHPFPLLSVVRHVATPFPCLPPKPTAMFTIDGITMMHLASARILVGIPLSGVPMISSSTLAELSKRLTISGSVFESCVSNLAGLVGFVSDFFVSSVEVFCCVQPIMVRPRNAAARANLWMNLMGTPPLPHTLARLVAKAMKDSLY